MNALSLLLLVTISYNYGRNRDGERAVLYPLVALCSYVACVYKGEETAPLEIFSPPWLFTAIVVALGSSALFRCLVKLKPLRNRQYTEGADVLFNRAITAIWPAVLIVALFAALNVLLSEILGTTALHNVASDLFMTLFEQVGRNFGGALLFILSIHLLWFLASMAAMCSMGWRGSSLKTGSRSTGSSSSRGARRPKSTPKPFSTPLCSWAGAGPHSA